MGWSGLANGELLRVAETRFDVLITGDRNLSFQQKVSTFNIAVVVLHAKTTQLNDTLVLMKKVNSVLETITPGEIADVYA